MQLVLDAGFTGFAIVALFVVALAARATGRSSSSTSWALGLLSLGAVGQGLAQRAVRDAVLALHAAGEDVAAIVAQGSAEASANLLLAGAAALIVVVVGAARDNDRA
ncbi:MAG TPA: hypothetical protein VGF99_05485 [Myxococcota bacterium]